jgi:hypothetical protein
MKKTNIILHRLGASGAVLSGLAHLFYKTVSHGQVLPHVVFFGLMGLVQVWWGWQFFFKKKTNELFLQAGVAINGGFILMWLVTRFINPPFMTSPESFEIIGWSVAVLQLLAIVAILLEKTKDKNHWKNILVEIVIIGFVSVATMFALYGSGKMGESFFPELVSTGHHEVCTGPSCGHGH